MGLSNRKKTNRRFNGTKMVVNNSGISSTIQRKNEFLSANNYQTDNQPYGNFIPCSFNEGNYDEIFNYGLSVNSCLDQNPFYGKNKLIVCRDNGVFVLDSTTGEVIYSNTELTSADQVVQLPLNQYLLIGRGTSYQYFTKLNSDLTKSSGFFEYFSTKRQIRINNFALTTPDNKIIVYFKGSFTPYTAAYNPPSGVSIISANQQIFKIDYNGIIDGDFHNNTNNPQPDSEFVFQPPSTAFVTCIEILPIIYPNDYKILVGGKFNNYQNVGNINITFLDKNGAIDDEWLSPFTEINDYVTSIKYVGNGKFLVGGFFTEVGTNKYSYILRMESLDYGVGIDETFISPNLTGPVTSIDLDINGKILVTYNNINSGNQKFYARLNANGSVDNTFNRENIIGTGNIRTNFIYKSSNGGYFLSSSSLEFENGNNVPPFIKLKGC